MFHSLARIATALESILEVERKRNELLGQQNEILTRIADEMNGPRAVGIEAEHGVPEPRT